MPNVDSSRLANDADFAADYFAGKDVNSAQRQLSEDGATVNLMEVAITLANRVNELRGVGTPQADEEALADENTPASQKHALELGKAANERAASEGKETSKTANVAGDKKNPPSTPNQPSDSSGIQL